VYIALIYKSSVFVEGKALVIPEVPAQIIRTAPPPSDPKEEPTPPPP
jgi:hypothetical protein